MPFQRPTPSFNITPKPNGSLAPAMRFWSWFRRTSATEDAAESESTEVESEDDRAAEFAALQEQRTREAQSLFEAPDAVEETHRPVEAPYDASEAEVVTLLENDGNEAFTHRDEVVIEDVTALDDPYERAVVEGDLPQTVVLGEDQNGPSV